MPFVALAPVMGHRGPSLQTLGLLLNHSLGHLGFSLLSKMGCNFRAQDAVDTRRPSQGVHGSQAQGLVPGHRAGDAANVRGLSARKRRLNRTLLETSITMLPDSGVLQKLWAETVVHAVYLHNVINSAGGQTPWELVKGERPEISTVKIFGAPYMVKVPNLKWHKLAPKSEYGKLLGFDLRNLKAYHVLTSAGVVLQSCDFAIQEGFESKVERIMHDFETDAGIALNPVLAPTSLSTTAPAVQQLNEFYK
jgi:hypothetical protein